MLYALKNSYHTVQRLFLITDGYIFSNEKFESTLNCFLSIFYLLGTLSLTENRNSDGKFYFPIGTQCYSHTLCLGCVALRDGKHIRPFAKFQQKIKINSLIDAFPSVAIVTA